MVRPGPDVALTTSYLYWLFKSKQSYFHIEQEIQRGRLSGSSHWFNSSIKHIYFSIILLYYSSLVIFVFSKTPLWSQEIMTGVGIISRHDIQQDKIFYSFPESFKNEENFPRNLH